MTAIKPVLLLSGILGLVLLAGCAKRREPAPQITRPAAVALSPQALLAHAQYLAADSLAGRRAGTAGEMRAAEYIRDTFRHYGLEPAPGGYFQPFSFPDFVSLGNGNALSFTTPDHQTPVTLAPNHDFRPLGISTSKAVSGPLVFVGYGIHSTDPAYNDYAGVNVSGKLVLMLTQTPAGSSAVSPFGEHRDLSVKALAARLRGAVAVLLVTGPADSQHDQLPLLRPRSTDPEAGLPMVHLTRRAADSLLAVEHLTIAQLQQELNRSRLPLSHIVTGVTVHITTDLHQEQAASRNVLAVLPGTGQLRRQLVLLGAHYDHLGLGGPGSGSAVPQRSAVHNGADDNASGVAVMLEVARYLAEHPPGNGDRRSIMFQAFGAGEPGLYGSVHAAANLPVPMDDVTAMVNLHMVGRLDSAGLVLGGANSSPLWLELLPALNHAGMRLQYSASGTGDHQSFLRLQIPALSLSTGRHQQYHHPDDDVQRLNLKGMQLVGQLVARLVQRLAVIPEPPPFIGAPPRAQR